MFSVGSGQCGLVHKKLGSGAQRLCTKTENWENDLAFLFSSVPVLPEACAAKSSSYVFMICNLFFGRSPACWDFKMTRSCGQKVWEF